MAVIIISSSHLFVADMPFLFPVPWWFSIHYGKFVAESKFMSDTGTFTAAIRARDLTALTHLITKPIVEEQVLARVHAKAALYGRPPAPAGDNTPIPTSAYKIPPTVIAELYENIMTMTKDVQIEYLLKRLD